MKNYVVITTLDQDMNIFGTFHNVGTMNVLEQRSLENTLAQCEALDVNTPMQYGKVYYLDSDTETDLESAMRTLGFRRCDRCNAWVTPQDRRSGASTYERETGRLCPSCVALANENPSRQVTIHGYHGSGNQFRYRQMPHESMSVDNFQGLGFELEIDNGTRRMRTGSHFNASQEFARWNRSSQNLRFEDDGSLNNGFEMISQCFSIEYFRNLDLAPMFAQAKALGADDAYPTSGLHWHFSKTLLGDTPKEQALNFLKIMFVLSVYANDFKKISGRNLDNANAFYYCGFANMDTVNRYKAMIESDTSDDPFHVFRSGSSHCGGASAFLIPSGKTIEYRFFKSCTNPEKFRHIAELLIGITTHIKDVKWSKIYCMGKVFKGVPSETMEYWRKNGAFLNTYATTARGESIALAQAQ